MGVKSLAALLPKHYKKVSWIEPHSWMLEIRVKGSTKNDDIRKSVWNSSSALYDVPEYYMTNFNKWYIFVMNIHRFLYINI